MTNEDIIYYLNALILHFKANYEHQWNKKDIEVFECIVEKMSNSDEDCISRKAVLDLAEWFDLNQQHFIVENLIDEVENMPSIQPKPKTDVLDKIRAEIEQNAYPIVHGVNNHEKGMTLYGILEVIDKYKAEGSNKDTDKGNDCNSCKYQKEVDGSNCYECVKGVRNNYTAESEG